MWLTPVTLGSSRVKATETFGSKRSDQFLQITFFEKAFKAIEIFHSKRLGQILQNDFCLYVTLWDLILSGPLVPLKKSLLRLPD